MSQKIDKSENYTFRLKAMSTLPKNCWPKRVLYEFSCIQHVRQWMSTKCRSA